MARPFSAPRILVPLDDPSLLAVVRLRDGSIDVTTVEYRQGSVVARENLPVDTKGLCRVTGC